MSMNTNQYKTVTITLSHNRKVKLLFTRPTTTANWICQATDETVTDMIRLFDEEMKDE